MSGLGFDRAGKVNAASFSAVDQAMWAGNQWMINSLCLQETRAGTLSAGLLSRLQVPFSYMWSPSFVPKPADWPAYVEVVGAFTAGAGAPGIDERPYAALLEWLRGGAAPVFVGFGSMVISDTAALSKLIVAAARASGQRVLVQSGWSKMDVGDEPLCFDVGPVSHDWLLPQVAAVVHHGGAGTTAAGLRYGKPTLVCPFFGDQFFWGEMVSRAGAGPKPCPIGELSAEVLASKFERLCTEEVRTAAVALAARAAQEDGVGTALRHWKRCFPRHSTLCDVSLLLPQPQLTVARFVLAPYAQRRFTAIVALGIIGTLAAASWACPDGQIPWTCRQREPNTHSPDPARPAC